MRDLYRIPALIWLITIASLSKANVLADNNSLPDSLITDDYVYGYTFSDLDKAESIIRLAALYETHEKDIIIQKQGSDVYIRNLWLGLTASIIVLSSAILYCGIKYYRKIRFKNNALIRNIDRMLYYKEELYRVKDTNFTLEEKIHILNDTLENLQSQQEEPETTEEDTESEPEECGEVELGLEIGDERYSKELFEQMDHLITNGQLYLDPKFCGEKARKLVGISRNQFAPFIKTHTGGRFLKYLSKYRLYHAVRLLQENPDYSIETVAQESGIPALRSFHRLFLEEFGVTPMEYRKKSKCTDS